MRLLRGFSVMPAFLVWGKGSRFPNGQRFTDLRSALLSPFMAAFDPKPTLRDVLSGHHASPRLKHRRQPLIGEDTPYPLRRTEAEMFFPEQAERQLYRQDGGGEQQRTGWGECIEQPEGNAYRNCNCRLEQVISQRQLPDNRERGERCSSDPRSQQQQQSGDISARHPPTMECEKGYRDRIVEGRSARSLNE